VISDRGGDRLTDKNRTGLDQAPGHTIYFRGLERPPGNINYIVISHKNIVSSGKRVCVRFLLLPLYWVSLDIMEKKLSDVCENEC
jgi:hypothetical protein